MASLQLRHLLVDRARATLARKRGGDQVRVSLDENAGVAVKPAMEVLARMIDEGPWFALAEGETFEDMIFAALTSRGAICCPDYCRPV